MDEELINAFLDKNSWNIDCEREIYEVKEDHYNALRELEIPLFQSNSNVCTRMTIGELLDISLGVKAIKEVSLRQAKKSLARFGIAMTKNYDVFIARSKNRLLEKELKKHVDIYSLECFLRRLPDIRICLTPRRLFGKAFRGVLIKIEDFQGLLSQDY